MYHETLFSEKQMRNTTKIKHLLGLYHLDLSMDGDGLMHLTITHRSTGEQKQFESTKYAVVIEKAFRYMSKETRKSDYFGT
jgi:hypothetical protein